MFGCVRLGYLARTMKARVLTAKAWQRTLLFLLVLACQGILAQHDAQHMDAQPSTCSVCSAHLPQIVGEAPGIVFARPMVAIIAPAPRNVPSVRCDRPRAPFQSRAPPDHLS